MLTMPPLEPCPFCGSKDVALGEFRDDRGDHAVLCRSCLALGPRTHNDEEAARLWNNRPMRRRRRT